MTPYARCTITTLALLLSSLGHCGESPQKWRDECIGYYRLSLPGEVEYAVTPPENFVRRPPDPVRYADGILASYSHQDIEVSTEISREEFARLKEGIDRNYDSEVKAHLKRADETAIGSLRDAHLREAAELKSYSLGETEAFAWGNPEGAEAFLYRTGRAYRLAGANDELSGKKRSFKPRPPFTIPQQPGECFPYGFRADDGKRRFRLAVAMRLKEHPDVEIFFSQDSPPELSRAAERRDAEGSIRFFWESRYAFRAEKVRLTGFPSFRTVELAGRKGKETFAELTRRENGAIDYGYLAYVKGEHSKDADLPHLMLYVIRTASQSRGKTPVTETELKQMAETIAASVKKRW